jgi:hypothetical protein
MTNYDPFRPIPQTKPRPNEKLWEVWARHKLFSCELKYHGEFGVEAQIFEDGWLPDRTARAVLSLAPAVCEMRL